MKQNISQRKFVTLWNCNGGCCVGDISEYHRLSGFSSRGYAHVGGMCDSPWGSFFWYEMFAGQGVTLPEDIYRFCGRHRSMFLFRSQLGVAYMTSQMLMAGFIQVWKLQQNISDLVQIRSQLGVMRCMQLKSTFTLESKLEKAAWNRFHTSMEIKQWWLALILEEYM
jgi:hypothetical protein